MSDVLERNTEFETKYRVDMDFSFKLKNLMSDQDHRFVYTEGVDQYWTNREDKNSFVRVRRETYGPNGGSWVTWKWKPEGANNNIKRKEINWTVKGTSEEDISAALIMQRCEKKFKIYKTNYIYKLKDATLVFYTVQFENLDTVNAFFEIEVDEQEIDKGLVTELAGYKIIKKYEDLLAPIGITPQKRLKKSLYEIYCDL